MQARDVDLLKYSSRHVLLGRLLPFSVFTHSLKSVITAFVFASVQRNESFLCFFPSLTISALCVLVSFVFVFFSWLSGAATGKPSEKEKQFHLHLSKLIYLT